MNAQHAVTVQQLWLCPQKWNVSTVLHTFCLVLSLLLHARFGVIQVCLLHLVKAAQKHLEFVIALG